MNPAYLDGLKMLARRELSEAQVRQRLARRQHDPDAVDEAIARLKMERAIDDARTAAAIARTETAVKRRGRLRVTQAIDKAGIGRATARRALDDVFATLDHDALIEAALTKRLRGREAIKDDKEFARLYRFLLGQGFESDRVMKTLESHRRSRG
jgi:regulatory protein